jgi:hypothetical protein
MLEEVNDICETIMQGPDKDNQSVQVRVPWIHAVSIPLTP